jgi:hypothetical protein
VHRDGYTRRYTIKGPEEGTITTAAVTCYRDGHIVTDGYLDFHLDSDKGLNPNWFFYEIQRHLQLTAEVLNGLSEEATLVIKFDHLKGFRWEVYRAHKISDLKQYVGYHRDIVAAVELAAIPGRDKWDTKVDQVEYLMAEVARMFGMDRLPQPYWDQNSQLDYSRGFPMR